MNCSKCKQNPKAVSSSGNEYYWCKPCISAYEALRYLSRKQYAAKKALDRSNMNADRLRNLKSNTPCFDCDRLFPHYIMEFDHREPEKKLDAVATLAGKSTWLRVESEIAKCDLVCANCHRTRTWNRRESKASESDQGDEQE